MILTMKKRMKIMAISSLVLVLSGCGTAVLWENTDKGYISFGKVVDTTKSVKVVETDHILGFAQVNNTRAASKKLVIVGQQYAYLMKDESESAFQILDSSLDVKHIRLYEPKAQKYHLDFNLLNNNVKSLKDGVGFQTKIHLLYDKNKSELSLEEQNTLQRLGFSEENFAQNNAQQDIRYVKVMAMQGKVLGLNDELRSLKFQSFSQAYSINIYANYVDKDVDFKTLFKKIALTPVALVGDLVVIPIGVVIVGAGSALGVIS